MPLNFILVKRMIKVFKAELKVPIFLLFLLLLFGLANQGCAGPTWRGWSGFASQDGILYFGSMDGRVFAINPVAREQGKAFPDDREWVFKIPTAATPRGMCGPLGCAPAAPPVDIYATPVVINDLVCMATYAGHEGKLVALNRLSPGYTEGVPLRSKGEWTYPSNVRPIGAIVGSPVLADNTIYVGTSDGKVYALDALYGEKKWEFDTKAKIWTSPAFNDGVIYVSNYERKLFAISTADGSLIWEIELPATIASSPTIYKDKIFLGTFDHNLYAVNAITGHIEWKFKGNGWFWSAPVVRDDVVYAGCLDHKIYAVMADLGEEIWHFSADGQIVSTAALIDNLLIVVSNAGTLYMLNADNGRLEHNPVPLDASARISVRAPLYAEGNTVYVHASNRCVYCIDVYRGEVLWKFPYSNIK